MYIDRDKAEKLLEASEKDTIDGIKGQSDFLLSLLDGDDWSLVIKSHALIESIVTELIVTRIDEPRTRAFVERLPLSNAETGKLRLAKDFDLIGTNARSFVKAFSALRNSLVHKIENVTFDFSVYVETLDENRKRQWQFDYSWYEREEDYAGKGNWKSMSLSKPRWAVFMAVFMFATLHSLKTSELKTSKSIQLASQDTMQRLLGPSKRNC